MRFRIAILFLSLIIFTFGCDTINEGIYHYGLRTRPNVVVITVESLRADRMKPEITPNLDAMAERGVLLQQAQSTSSWALPAVASAFTGLYPPRHGLENAQLKNGKLTVDRLNYNHDTLAEVLEGYGYATYGLSTNGRMGRLYGFDQGMNRYDCRDGGTHRTVKAWLSRMTPYFEANVTNEVPYFLWIHFSDSRFPYLPERPFIDKLAPQWEKEINRLVINDLVALVRDGTFSKDESLVRLVRALYDSEVAAVDAGIADVLDVLPGVEDAVVAILGTNGESLGDHGCLGSGDNVYGESIHVPWLLLLPHRQSAGVRVDEPVTLADLMPTILALADVPCPAEIDGINLVPVFEGHPLPDRAVFSDLRRPRILFRAAIQGPYKLIEQSPPQTHYLFDVTSDPSEGRNLAQQSPSPVEDLAAKLADHAASVPSFPGEKESQKVGFETMQQLRAVGYLR